MLTPMALGAQFPANAIPHCCSVISSFTRPPSRTISLNHCCFWHPTRHMRCMALAMPIMASPRVEEPAQIPGRKTKKEQVHITDKMRGRPMKGRSEEHTSELQSLMSISYADLYLKTKQTT